MGQNLISVAAQVLGLWLLSYVIDFSNGEALYFLRVGYILSVGFSLFLFTIVYSRLMTNLAKETATTPQKWFVVEKTFFQTAPKVIKRTELQHEYSEFWGRVGQMFTQVVVVVFLHLYLGYAEAALIQAGLNFTECLSHPLVRRHVFGAELDNPWEGTDQKPAGAIEVTVEGEAVNAEAAIDQDSDKRPSAVPLETWTKLKKLILDAWDQSPDTHSEAICEAITSFLDVIQEIQDDADDDVAIDAANIQTEEGWTMLMIACGQARTSSVLDVIPRLLAAGIDPTTTDNDGETCVDWAVNHRNKGAIELVLGTLESRRHSEGMKVIRHALKSAHSKISKTKADVKAARKLHQDADTDVSENSKQLNEATLQERLGQFEAILKFLEAHKDAKRASNESKKHS